MASHSILTADHIAQASIVAPIDSVHPHPRNANRGDVEAIRESLRVHGQFRTIVVQKSTGNILAGNSTWAAAKAEGFAEIAAILLDVDDEQAVRILIADNRLAELGEGYDERLLAELLGSLPDLEGTGFEQDELEQILGRLAEEELPPVLADPDDVPEVPAEPRSKPGDVWLLGLHRVVCGDSTTSGAYEALFVGDERAHMIWTDPPYGLTYSGGSKERDAIENDALSVEERTQFLRDAFGLAMAHTIGGAAWYVTAPDGPIGLAFSIALHEIDVWRHSLIWVKNKSTFGRSDYHYRHEPIYYGWTPGAARLHQVEDRTLDTIWEFDRPSRSEEHPTMKPVALIVQALENSSARGELILDPFGGSGSTLIAAHQTGRVARLIELDPRYVDVICRRYQEATGTLPVLEATGSSHDFTAG